MDILKKSKINTKYWTFLKKKWLVGSARSSGDDMKCYSEKDGSKFQLCQKRLGYRTCFVQYDKGKPSDIFTRKEFWENFSDGGIVRRGCSTKNPMFHVECENHVSGIKSERFCYCSYHLCNYQRKISENILLIMSLSILVRVLSSWRTCYVDIMFYCKF